MKSYFDTSVLFPALTQAHPHNKRCLAAYQQAIQKGKVLCLSMHVYAELYANLTRFPLGNRIPPEVAAETIIKLKDAVVTVDLDRADYEAAIRRCAEKQLVSGIIYDALHLQAAIKAGVDALYTSNMKDFKRLYSEDLSFDLIAV